MAEAKLVEVRADDIKPSPYQVREQFDDKGIEELAKSIDKYGLMYPLLVRPIKGKLPYEIVHGERRWRAVQKLGQRKILTNIRQMPDNEARVIGLTENIQREELKPHEVAKALKVLRDAGLSSEEIAKKTDKSVQWVKELIGFEEKASPELKQAVERYYEEPAVAAPLQTVSRSPIPSVPISSAVEITNVTKNLPIIQRKVVQERFAKAITKAQLSPHETREALHVWEEKKKRIAPEQAVKVVERKREEEQAKAADVVWLQFDKELQDGVKLAMARENLPTVRDTVMFLVRYALEELNIIKSRR